MSENWEWMDRLISIPLHLLNSLFLFVCCSEIGTALQHSYFGPGSGLFHYARLGCRGNEKSLLDCRSRKFVTSDCNHGNEAGVVCEPPEGQGSIWGNEAGDLLIDKWCKYSHDHETLDMRTEMCRKLSKDDHVIFEIPVIAASLFIHFELLRVYLRRSEILMERFGGGLDVLCGIKMAVNFL